MSDWYKVTIPFKEAGLGGEATRLQQAFEMIFMLHGAPKGAALFTNHDDDFKDSFFYFSPDATAIAKSLIDTFKGVVCSPPQTDQAVLLVGHSGAREDLLPAAGNS